MLNIFKPDSLSGKILSSVKKIVSKLPLSFWPDPAWIATHYLTKEVIAPITKSVAQAAPRTLVAGAIEIPAQAMNQPATLKPKWKIEQAIFWEKEIKWLFKQTTDAVPVIKNFLAKKWVPDSASTWISLAVAPLFVGWMATLDLTPIGWAQKNAAKLIAKSKNIEEIVNTIRPIFNWASDDTLKTLAKPLVSINKASEVKTYLQQKVLDSFKSNPWVPVIEKIIKTLEEAKSLRWKQETIYSQERAKRLGESLKIGEKEPTEAWFYKSLTPLKWEFSKVEFESLRWRVSQEEIDSVFKQLIDSPELQWFEKITAGKALGKIFGEFGWTVPTEWELALLNRVFPQELTKTLLSKQSTLKKLSDIGYDVVNVPRSIMASFDVSAPLRQGIFLAGSHPKTFIKWLFDQFKYFGSEKSFNELQKSIISNPLYKLADESGLQLTSLDAISWLREEKFATPLAEKIPLVGAWIRASGRAYTGFLNKLRMDVFSDLVTKAQKTGRNPLQDIDLSKSIATFVNAASGRGKMLKQLEPASKALNAFFFSPRLMASRLGLLNPKYYITADPFVRKEALKSLFAFTWMIGTVWALASLAWAKVSTNSNSSDFAKIKIGDTRVDLAGGFQQYIVAASRLMSGKYVSSTSGKESTLGEGYKPTTRYDIALRTLENKEAPVASFITALLKQQDPLGEKIDLKKEIVSRFTPMILQDMIELYKEDPSLLPLAAIGALGGGVQTYQNQKSILKKYKPTWLKPYNPSSGLKPYKP